MRFKRFALILSLFVFAFSACTVSKQMKQLDTEAQQRYNEASYAEAFDLYGEIISIKTQQGKEVETTVYQNAGIAAWHVGKFTDAINYLEKVKERSSTNAQTYYYIAKAYLKVDNLSREITNLEEFTKIYADKEEITEVNHQLFMAYVRSENWDKAYTQWPLLSSNQQEEVLTIEAYIKVTRQLGYTDKLLPIASKLLKSDSKNVLALEVLAMYYYNLGEDSYQVEMKAYEKNRTNKQYKQLLEALKVINENFKISRDYFERLYKLNPEPKFANYLGNIYTRFDNKSQANYYYRKAKQN